MPGKYSLLFEGIDILYKNILTANLRGGNEESRDSASLCGLNVSKSISLLERYINEIELFNPAYGLVKVKDTNELIIKHILDSLAPLKIFIELFSNFRSVNQKTDMPRIADVGSGAGLPGFPLAIALPQCGFTLIERMGRRAGFLRNTKAVLELSNVVIEENDIEKTAPGRFDIITFRAFLPLEPELLKKLSAACAPGGIIAAYKGKKDKIEAEIAPLENYHSQCEILPLTVPFLDEERHLLLIKKPE
ncbi:MAG: 16S rRNA (guanine(527)-N(7))-methyltransferase RsmG [Treponema sp.]|nr:16S rRNA (guanine(527)-N(7))-methyltransferase RsmG [Treponema sp.]